MSRLYTLIATGLAAASAGPPADTTPDAFSFVDLADAGLSTIYESNTITLTGIDAPANLSITGGQYSVNGAAWSAANRTVQAGDTVKVRATSSANFSTAVNVVLIIGGVSDTFTVTTAAETPADTTPDAFSFTDVTGAALSTVYESNTITVSGIDAGAALSISGGEYAINGGAWATAATSVANGDTVKVRATSAASNSAAVNVVLTIGGVSDTYTVTTAAAPADTTPDAFAFTDVTGAALSTNYESNAITVSGIDTAANLTVSGGEYQINGGAWATAATTVSNGDTVKVRCTSSASNLAAVNVVLTIGGVSDTYTVTTEAASGFTVLLDDDSSRPLSVGGNLASYNNGSYVGGRFAHSTLEAGVGNVVMHNWEDGYATTDPHLTGTRRDDQTYVYNALSPAIMALGHMPVKRDTVNQRTHLRVRPKANLPEGASLTPHQTEARVDGSITGAMLNYRHAIKIVGPRRISVYDVNLPDITALDEFWFAIWDIQADSHQSVTNAALKTEVTPGAHTEDDGLELTGYKGFSANWQRFLRAAVHLYSTVTDLEVPVDVTNDDGFGYVDLGGGYNVFASNIDIQYEYDGTNFYWRFKLAGDPTWITFSQAPKPANTRVDTAPVGLIIDAKAGSRWSDQSASWVGNVDAATEYEVSYARLVVETPTANVANCTVRVIDQSTVPAVTFNWGAVDKDAINGSSTVGAVLCTLPAHVGYTYEAYGITGADYVGNELQVTGVMNNETGAIQTWLVRTSDNARFLCDEQTFTVTGAPSWAQLSGAAVDIDFATSNAYDHGTFTSGDISALAVAAGGGIELVGAARTALQRAAGHYRVEFTYNGTGPYPVQVVLSHSNSNSDAVVWNDGLSANFNAGGDRNVPIPTSPLTGPHCFSVGYGASGTRAKIDNAASAHFANAHAAAGANVYVGRSIFNDREGLTIHRFTYWEDTDTPSDATLGARNAL